MEMPASTESGTLRSPDFTTAELDAIRSLYGSPPSHVPKPEDEFVDLILLALGERPAASSTCVVKDGGREPPVEADPISDFIEVFDFECLTFIRQREGLTHYSHYITPDAERLDALVKSEGGRFSKGRFLGYPLPAIRDNVEGKHANRWYDFLRERDRSLTDEQVAGLAVLPYVPTCTEGGLRRGIRRGRHYHDRLEPLARKVPPLAGELDQKVETINERLNR